jgi:hypothetical protein
LGHVHQTAIAMPNAARALAAMTVRSGLMRLRVGLGCAGAATSGVDATAAVLIA